MKVDCQKKIDKIYEITDMLEHDASRKLSEAQAYHKGYIQACEDFGKALRLKIYEHNEEAGECDT